MESYIMKYPYIGKTELGSIVLFHKESTGRVIKHVESIPVGRVDDDWCEFDFKNITSKYLANTYGEVVSPEHAEFIAELAKVNGFKVWSFKRIDEIKTFTFENGELCLLSFHHEGLDSRKLKQITIPIPPRQIQTATPEEEFEMKQIMKNAGDNLVLGCEDSKCDEWPKVGDEVLVFSSVRRLAEIKGKAVKVIGKCTHSDGDTILTVEHSSLGVFAAAKESCIKPKTAKEELRDWMHERIGYGIASGFDCEQITHDLLHHLNITKKPQ